MKILYFAWIKDRIGASEEDVSPPEDIRTVSELVRWLGERGEGHAAAFADLRAVRCAVNQEHASFDHPVREKDEVAFFPPVTGGAGP